MIDSKTGGDGVADGFVELPHQAYQGDPLWIPEVAASVVKAFGADNPWFKGNRAVTACLPGRARAAGFFDPACVVDGEPTAFFGYWDTVGDADANRAVMTHIESWASEQGAKQLFGPINFSTYGPYRVLLSIEEGAVPFPGEPYNPARYPTELEALGFALHQRYETHVGPIPAPARTFLSMHLNGMRDAGYRFEPLTLDLWMSNLREIHSLVDDIFGDNFAYTPLSFDAFAQAAGEALVVKSCPRASVIAWGPEGDIAGILLSYPAYGPIVNQGAGDGRVSVASLRYDDHMPALVAKGPVDGLMKTVGTHPEHRRRGIQTALGACALEQTGDMYARWIAPLIREGNPSGNVSKPFARHMRYYGLYSKKIG